MSSKSSGFCDDPVWDNSLTFNSSWPQFTLCFQDTVLTLLPCGYLWFSSPFYTWYLLQCQITSSGKTFSKLFCLKLVFMALIIIPWICDFANVLSSSSSQFLRADVLSPFVQIITLSMAFCFSVMERRRRFVTSGVLFVYWTLYILAFIIPYYSYIKLEMYDSDPFTFSTFQVRVLFTVVEFILQFLAEEPVYSDALSEKPNPVTAASFPSRLTFVWLNSLISTGYKKTLVESDMPDLRPNDSSSTVVPLFFTKWCKAVRAARERLKPKTDKSKVVHQTDEPEIIPLNVNAYNGERNTDEIATQPHVVIKSRHSHPSLIGTLFRTFWIEYLVSQVCKAGSTILGICNPFLLGALVDFVEDPSMQVWKGFVLAATLFISKLFQTLLFNQSIHVSCALSIRVRASLISSLFRKSLTMDNNARKEHTAGEVVNLMSVDTDHIATTCYYLWAMWSGPFQIAMCLYLLYYQIGLAMLAGAGFLVLMVPVNSFVTMKLGKMQSKILALKDERMKMMNELLIGIKIVKLNAWEASFEKQVLEVRNKELILMRKTALLQAAINFGWSVAPFVVSLLSFLTFIYSDSGHHLNARIAFESIALFNIMRAGISFIPLIVNYCTKAFVSSRRIGQFLFHDDLDENCPTRVESAVAPITIINGTYSWNPDLEPTLMNINVTVRDASLVAIVGPVGSGKSSLLAAILGEIQRVAGETIIRGNVSYVAQQAWIQNDTVKNNILFGKTYDEQLYKRCIEACALQPDLDILPAGDETEIGERGINLSGGQKQRVSLARAVYAQVDIYLLDDPLSAVDSHVGKHIFEHVILDSGLLAGKVRVLVTHGIYWLPHTDHIITLTNGQVSESGQYESLLSHKGEFALLISTFLLQEGDGMNDDQDYQEVKQMLLRQLSEKDDDTGLTESLPIPDYSLKQKISRESGGAVVEWLMKQASKKSVQTSRGLRPTEGSLLIDGVRHKPAKKEEVAERTRVEGKKIQEDNSKLIEEETVEFGKVKWEVIHYYAKNVGYFFIVFLGLCHSLYIAGNLLSMFWLSKWTDDRDLGNFTEYPANSSERMDKNIFYIAIYGAFGLLQTVAVVISTVTNSLRCIHASRILHANLLSSILHAPMTYFDTTPVGRILNRFSKDLAEIDDDLPSNFFSWMECVMMVLASFVFISVNLPISIGFILFLAILYFFIQRFYITTSRQLKRLQSKMKSPIFNHFSETLAGASVIRAFGSQKQFIDQSEARVDAYHSLAFPTFCANRWLAIRLDFIGSLVILTSATIAVASRDSISGGLMGLVIIYSLEITLNLNWMVKITSDLENIIVSVERIKQYSEIDSEAPWEMPDCPTASSWPEEGGIRLEGLSLRYRDGLDLVLKDLTLDILPTEKVGIVGRTGAGKSSLTVALFRLVEPSGGRILIDGVDITSLGLHHLRSKVTILPQDPVIFAGSLRQNMDPFGEHSDESLWNVLEHAHLKEFVESLPDMLGHQCGEGGDSLSVGQRQLLCLGRALLRKTKVFILDEATAAIDMVTDELIQETIRKELKDCTILTIAHRLNTVMDYDRILVLDNGQVEDFDSPENLLQKSDDIFYNMAKTAGIVS